MGPAAGTGRTAGVGRGQERQEGWDQGGKSVNRKEAINRRSNRKGTKLNGAWQLVETGN